MKSNKEVVKELRTEIRQLEEKQNRLNNFLHSEEIDKVSVHQRCYMTAQLAMMHGYLEALNDRYFDLTFGNRSEGLLKYVSD